MSLWHPLEAPTAVMQHSVTPEESSVAFETWIFMDLKAFFS